MLLSDDGIRKAFAGKRFWSEPWAPELVQPASLDFRLGRCFRTFANHRHTHIDPSRRQDDLTELVEVPEGEAFVLHPGEFVLGSTLETFTLDNTLAARAEGKSSLGRLGLLVHSTAGFIDPGFRGQVTLELSNVANLPITLWPGMKIGQLCLLQLSSPADDAYGAGAAGSRYQGQTGPTPSKSWKNWRTWPTTQKAHDTHIEHDVHQSSDDQGWITFTPTGYATARCSCGWTHRGPAAEVGAEAKAHQEGT